jgi:hypothetical protein
LAKAHPGINNALHKAWLDKFKTPMTAEGLDKLPDTFNDEAKLWYKETIRYMQDQLTDVERGLRGLPATRDCRTKASAKISAQTIAERSSRAKAAKLVKNHPEDSRTVTRKGNATDSDDEEILSVQTSKR